MFVQTTVGTNPRHVTAENVVLSKDAQGNVSGKAFDSQGKPVAVKEIQLENRALLCLPKQGELDPAKEDCQVVSFVSDGSLIKLGTNSCYCVACGRTGICYGHCP
jgi:hypothetical protein